VTAPGRVVFAVPTRVDWPTETPAPGAASRHWLVVVRRDQLERDPAAGRWFDDPLCLVVVDRRHSERRRARRAIDTDRRRGERRQALTGREAEQWCRAGYRLVYRGEGARRRDGRMQLPAGEVTHAGSEP
jgi:hypothetical protein